jgi:hypothetical protein
MKQISKFLILAAVMLSFTAATFAQSATATATATIVTPIALNRTSNMSFGNIIQTAPASTSSVVMPPTGALTYNNATASATPTITATISRATFDVTGSADAHYTITLPGAAVSLTGPGTAMTVDNFSSSPAGAGGVLSPTGTQTIIVGATLNIGANQAGGTYTSAPFTVTVGYN